MADYSENAIMVRTAIELALRDVASSQEKDLAKVALKALIEHSFDPEETVAAIEDFIDERKSVEP